MVKALSSQVAFQRAVLAVQPAVPVIQVAAPAVNK
jgi:hypothetical protein